MTLDEFLAALRERCNSRTFHIVSLGNWGVPRLLIRTASGRCPIGYMTNRASERWKSGSHLLRLSTDDAFRIVQAADRSDRPLRRRLEYACRLRGSED